MSAQNNSQPSGSSLVNHDFGADNFNTVMHFTPEFSEYEPIEQESIDFTGCTIEKHRPNKNYSTYPAGTTIQSI